MARADDRARPVRESADEGARSLLACALPLSHRRAAVLTLYAGRPASFDAAAELVAAEPDE